MKHPSASENKSYVVSNDTFNQDIALQRLMFQVKLHNQEVQNVKKMIELLPKKGKSVCVDYAMDTYNQTLNLAEVYVEKKDYPSLNNDFKFISIFPVLISMVLKNTDVEISLTTPRKMTDILFKDKAFKNYLIYAINRGASSEVMGTDILSIIFSYMFQDKDITLTKIKNFLSWYIIKSNSILKINGIMTDEQEKIIEQIKTAVKYEKDKNISPANRGDYTRITDKHFSLKNITEQYIKIKYISKKEYKHMFHKSPIEHIRTGHYRHYQTGKKVWIEPMLINQEAA